MTDERVLRGQALAARRKRLGIFTKSEFARRSGASRNAVTAAEAGTASEPTYDELEGWLDALERNEHHDPETIEFDVTGPRTEWHVVVRGPVVQADELRRQVAELLKDIDQTGE